MANLFWPGAERRGDQFGEGAFLTAMTDVEAAWLAALVDAGIAPETAQHDLVDLVTAADVAPVAAAAEATGNPVPALVDLLRGRLEEDHPEAARWLHRGLTSQDVVDTAVMLMLREVALRLRFELREQVETLIALAELHRDTPMVGRTITQHAVPITFGLKVAQWLRGILDTLDVPVRDFFVCQIGGAAGTMAATVELARGADLPDPERAAVDVARTVATTLGLEWVPPWHTSRLPVTRCVDAAAHFVGAWGRIANDVLLMSRPEIGELSEGTPGGSSTMPHKRNPVLAALVRRAALVVPGLVSSVHLASTLSVDERADGAWHAEWGILGQIETIAVVAASQTTALLAGLQVHPDRMAATLASSADDVLAEQRSMAELVGRPAATDPTDYLGAAGILVDEIVTRARAYLASYGVDL